MLNQATASMPWIFYFVMNASSGELHEIYVFYSSKDRNTKSANPIKTNQKQTTLQQTKEKSGKIKINLT